MKLEIFQADYKNPWHAQMIVELLNAYAADPMGGNIPLTEEVKEHLVPKLKEFPTAISILATVDGQPAGLINAFEAFSTFKCKPLINIHDIAVLAQYRNQKIGFKLLQYVEELAREKDCCKLTLEVLEGNTIARALYEKFGFIGYELDPKAGKALFFEKSI